jgi:hypothetical protein
MSEFRDAELRVSIIIPVHNRGEDLGHCLGAIEKAEIDGAEIIVVDDGSDDAAVGVALAKSPGIHLIQINDGPVGPARARNKAVAEARGEFLVFVDADVLIHPNAIHELLSPLIAAGPDGSVVATIGSYDDRPTARGVAATYANLRHHLVHQSARNPVPGFWTGLGAVRRSVFTELGGFQESFERPSIEDVEFGLRISGSGRKINVVPSALGTHLKAWTVMGLCRSDLFARGIPWGREMETHPALRWAMNGTLRNRVAILALTASALMIGLSMLAGWISGSGLAMLLLIPAVVGITVWSVLEAGLFRLLARRRGLGAMFGGAFLHAIHHLTVPSACMVGVLSVRWSSSTSRGWRAGLLGVLILLGLGILAVVSMAFLEPAAVLAWLADYESSLRGVPAGDFTPRYDPTSIELVKSRLSVMLIPLIACTLGIVWAGPTRIRSMVASIRVELCEALSLPRWMVVASVALVVVLGLGILRNLGIPMRTDEAGTLVSFGITDPFFIIGRYGTPNNHMLHSLMLWCSVKVLGIEPWAVRLPAMLATLAVVPLIAIAATRLWGKMAGLVAATIFVIMPFTVELATNARGYPLVIMATLVMASLLPGLRSHRTGAGALFVIAGTLGLIAVPIMAYPLGVLHAGLFLGRWRTEGVKAALRGTPLAILTIGIAAAAYLPAWIMATGSGPLETVVGYMNHDHLWSRRLVKTGSWIGKGWAQWVWPVSGMLGLLLLMPMGIGLVRSIRSGGAARMLALGLLVGAPAVYVMTGFAPPPWWTMVWIVPFLLLLFVFGCTPRDSNASADSRSAETRGMTGTRRPPWGLAVVVAGLAVLMGSPEAFQKDFAHRVWVGDVSDAARWLVDGDSDQGMTLATGMVHGPINYELLRRHGILRRVRIVSEKITEPHFPIRVLVTNTHVDEIQRPVNLLPLDDDSGIVLVGRHEFGGVVILEFDRVTTEPVLGHPRPDSSE